MAKVAGMRDQVAYAREQAVSAEEFQAVLAESGLGAIRPSAIWSGSSGCWTTPTSS